MNKAVYAYIIAVLTLVILAAAFFVYEGRIKVPEIRPAAYCQPYDEYERYETITVHSIDNVPADCKSLLIVPSEDTFIGTAGDDMLYGDYPYILFVEYQYDFIDEGFYQYKLIYTDGSADLIMDRIAGLNSLERLAIENVRLSDIEKLSRSDTLRSLYICGTYGTSNGHMPLNIDFSGNFPVLTDLTVTFCDIKNIGNIKNILTLERLNLLSNNIESIRGIEKLTKLSKLSICYNNIISFQPLKSMTQLTALSIGGNNASDLSFLRYLENLEALDISGCSVTALDDIKGLKKLRIMSAMNNKITDISAVSEFKELEHIDLTVNRISDVSPLAGLTELKYLKIMTNNISDVSPLSELANLEFLSVGNNRITDYSPLYGLPNVGKAYADMEEAS